MNNRVLRRAVAGASAEIERPLTLVTPEVVNICCLFS